MLRDFETRPEMLETEVQAIRVGDVYFVANSSEFFTPFALDVRRRADVPELMLACYANGRIGYLPDEHDINARSYAGYQSPKYCNQFPFTTRVGPGDVCGDAAGHRAVSQWVSECSRKPSYRPEGAEQDSPGRSPGDRARVESDSLREP